MSRTLTPQQVEAHMRQQTSEYLWDFLKMMEDLDLYMKENYKGKDGFKRTGKATDIAVMILKERGEWNA